MPKGFSDREKGIIRRDLMAAGIGLFGKMGVKKTTVEEGKGIVSMSNKSDARWSGKGPQAGGGK